MYLFFRISRGFGMYIEGVLAVYRGSFPLVEAL